MPGFVNRCAGICARPTPEAALVDKGEQKISQLLWTQTDITATSRGHHK
jgi:hypothetical protein